MNPFATLLETWKGGRILQQWHASGAANVPLDTALWRTRTCEQCPFNRRGGLLDFVTRFISNRIVKRLNIDLSAHTRKLYTCQLCGCGLKLKTRMPLTNIIFSSTVDQLEKLPAWCWIKKEIDAE